MIPPIPASQHLLSHTTVVVVTLFIWVIPSDRLDLLWLPVLQIIGVILLCFQEAFGSALAVCLGCDIAYAFGAGYRGIPIAYIYVGWALTVQQFVYFYFTHAEALTQPREPKPPRVETGGGV